jgi:hypothetical protein
MEPRRHNRLPGPVSFWVTAAMLVLVQYGPAPTQLVWWLLLGAFAARHLRAPAQMLGGCLPGRDRASRTSGSGARTVAVLFWRGEHGDAGDRDGREPQLTGGIPMYAQADNGTPSSRSFLMRLLVRSWEYRRPRLAVDVRIACGTFNAVLGVALLASIPWTGRWALLAALPLTGAALLFWTARRLQASARA